MKGGKKGISEETLKKIEEKIGIDVMGRAKNIPEKNTLLPYQAAAGFRDVARLKLMEKSRQIPGIPGHRRYAFLVA